MFLRKVYDSHFYVCPAYLHVFPYVFIGRVTIFKPADGLKICDIK